MRKYHASNQAPFGGFLLILLLAILSGLILGGILWAIDDLLHFYLVIVFPLFAGAIAGGVLTLGVRAGKVRSPFIAVLMGLLAGVIMFGVYHYASYYITFRGAVRDQYVQDAGKTPTDAQLDQFIDKGLKTETGDTGFVGFLRLIAINGFSITSTTASAPSTTDMELQGNVVWGYWALELLIAVVTAAWIAARAAGQPFDEDANTWYGKPTLLATATMKSRKPLHNALKDGDFQTAGSLLSPESIKWPRTEVLIRRSAAAGSLSQQDIYLTVNYAQRKGRTVIQRRGVVSPSELDLLKRAMNQPSPTGTTSSARFPL